MSLVSEAHRRASGEAVVAESPHQSAAIFKWVLIIMLAMALGSAATVWLISAGLTPRSDTSSERSAPAEIEDAASSYKPEPDATSGADEALLSEPSKSVKALYDRARVERDRIAQRAESSVVPSSAGQVAPPRTIAVSEFSETPRSAGIDEEQLLTRAQSLLTTSQREAALASSLPTVETLTEEVRDSIPTLLYSAHDYQAQGGSKVMINREWWAEGQVISGLKVLEIREKSTVFETENGTRFLQPALSSWVNL